MPHVRVVLLSCLALLVAIPAAAQLPLLLSPAQLAERLNDPNLVLLHVGERAGYDAVHIPGARYVDFRSYLHGREDDLTLQMLPAALLRERLAGLGISHDSKVVVYAAGGSFTPAARVVLTLDYAGLSSVSLLDGGLEAWTRDNRPVTMAVPAASMGTLAPLTIRPIVVDAEYVRSRTTSAGIAVVDARTTAFYDGSQTGGGQSRPHSTGHIAGARSVPFNTLTTDEGRMKPISELRSIFENAGVKPGDTVITYCHIGQQASAVAFAARLLGHKVMLYDGSFEDWSRRGLPVETGTPQKK